MLCFDQILCKPSPRSDKEDNKDEDDTSRIALLAPTFAIILHTVMEGMAVGVIQKEKEVALLAASIIIHKIPVGLTIGASFVKKGFAMC